MIEAYISRCRLAMYGASFFFLNSETISSMSTKRRSYLLVSVKFILLGGEGAAGTAGPRPRRPVLPILSRQNTYHATYQTGDFLISEFQIAGYKRGRNCQLRKTNERKQTTVILSVVGYDGDSFGVEPDHAPFVVLHQSHQTKIKTSTIVNNLEDSIIHSGCSSLIITIIDALALRSRWSKDNGLVII